MKVESIEAISAKKVQVTLEDGFSFPLYTREVSTYHIEVGKDISDETYHEIKDILLVKRSRARAMNLLVKKSFTVKELEKKLSDGGYPEQIVAKAIEYVSSFHYLDDKRYAYSYIAVKAPSTSKKMMELSLKRKGIDKEVFEKAFSEYIESEGSYDTEAMIANLIKKKGYNPETATPKDKQKIFAFLMRKGFQSSDVMHCLNIYD